MSEIDARFGSSSKPRVDVVCVIDLTLSGSTLVQRKAAYEEVQRSCQAANVALQCISFQKLDFGETTVVDQFHSADVAIIDLSIQEQQNSLLYLLGVRESFGMKQNLLMYNDSNADGAMQLRSSCANYTLITYKLNEHKQCIVTEPTNRLVVSADEAGLSPVCETKLLLSIRLKKLLQDVEVQTKTHMKDKFLSDLRKAREMYTGKELSQQLHNFRKRLDDPNIISCDVVYNMLISFREIQDYDAMVKLSEDLQTVPNLNLVSTPAITHLYAFALNRRNKEGDREKALQVIEKALEKKENHVPDMICLCGRIYKDKFVESNYQDKESLQKAIKWYRKGFEVQPNEYAGINLATLLVIDGESFQTSSELRRIGIVLNQLIGRKGDLAALQDYWDVATFFEISVLGEQYGKAIHAAECMFKLKPPDWYLKSTVGNIRLVNDFRKKPEDALLSPEEQIFKFWMEYFIDATVKDVSTMIRFPILILEPNKTLMPSNVTVNLCVEEKSLQIVNLCLNCMKKNECHMIHDWLINASNIRGVSLYKGDERCLFLYVTLNSNDFQMFFPSELMRQRFYDLVRELSANEIIADLESDFDTGPMQYEYEQDSSGRRKILGKGTYGSVYLARDLRKQRQIAIKEIPVKNEAEVQPLHEEIRLHSQLHHKNIVEYFGSVYEDGVFKIFMENVPGGSLSQLLREKWGPLKDSEPTIVFYTRQILKGLQYLHDQKIVHRDIKGDNVLVNTYSGTIKISDFGTSKRLAGLNPNTETFTGTFQYMAPEVIDRGQRGYGPKADIWSLGCTVVEMATGKTPYHEIGSGPEIIFKVGYYKVHPEIPATMSDKAKAFIKKCFEPDPDLRLSASELLEDPFLNDHGGTRKKKSGNYKSVSPTPLKIAHIDYNRSISVPADSANSKPEKNESKPEGRMNRFSSAGEETSEDAPFARRNSGGILSPPVEGLSTPGTDAEGGFYLLKKDSQRRTTLVQVMTSDANVICETWLHLLRQEEQGLQLTDEHLHILLTGLRDFLPEQNKESITKAIARVKEELEYDGAAISQIQMAFLHFHEAMNTVLRNHNIKPHWMFALDNLIRSASQAAITILSPELGENLAGNTRRESMTGSNVRPSTSHNISFHDDNIEEQLLEMREKYEALKSEHFALWQELINTEQRCIEVLRKVVTDKKIQIEMLNQTSPASSSCSMADSSFQHNPNIIIESERHVDESLVSWLQSFNVDAETIDKANFTREDVLTLMTREDLRRLNLRGGIELRIWKAIMEHRQASHK
ncbi:mitogen-activated protein kinase kinase kinase 5-like isoform X4 [Dinothrombium tinctorium]|uniref:mitogen-activated protein kinase kinase kinase n=1 Tax=Dinothrombium tinctorium TaxID=1965070 RepID=A0A443QWV8_9ACAR|nr:mitogen-activated protein kinase kinase kinase 5-like isoform X4 [Dinothrombium tinctorium]RWS07525.1 mitogen-activated protein kinase kinase kinase 5-like isoform X4 [Dinothrombium tinctorium]